MGILHRYVLRELLKTFALTATGLTLMFGMGGGLLNLIRIDQISAADVARLLLWFVPLVAAFMLPIAAMLSCALVYGRLAADNELDACKASGINILRLLASGIGLAVVVSAIAFYLSNYTVPHLFQRINEIAQGDIQDLLVAKLRDQGHLMFNKNYIIYADDARKLTPQEAEQYLGERDPGKQVLLIDKAAFVEFRDEDPLQTGTAEAILLILNKNTNPISVSARMLQVRVFDHQRLQFMGLGTQPLAMDRIPAFPTAGRMRLKFLDLSELRYFERHPIESPSIQDRLKRFRQEMTGLSLAHQIMDSMTRDKVAVVRNEAGQEWRIRARRLRLNDQGRRAKLELDAPVIEMAVDGRHWRIYRGGKGEIEFQTSPEALTVRMALRDRVTLLDPTEMAGPVPQASPCEPPSIRLPFEAIPAGVSYTDAQILATETSLPLPESLQKARTLLSQKVSDLAREITAAIHARLTMSASTLVLVLLAAALGIMLRGGHALTAFGVAFLPTVVVVLVITTGRTLAEDAATTNVGLSTMWGVLGLMILVDAIVILRGVRR